MTPKRGQHTLPFLQEFCLMRPSMALSLASGTTKKQEEHQNNRFKTLNIHFRLPMASCSTHRYILVRPLWLWWSPSWKSNANPLWLELTPYGITHKVDHRCRWLHTVLFLQRGQTKHSKKRVPIQRITKCTKKEHFSCSTSHAMKMMMEHLGV